MAAPSQHSADSGIDVIVEEEAHLPGCCELPPSFVYIGVEQVGEGFEDRRSVVAMPQIILDRGDPDAGTGENRSTCVHATLLDDTPCVVGIPNGGTADPSTEGIKFERLLQDYLVRSQVTFPGPVRVLEVDLAPHGGKCELPKRGCVAAGSEVRYYAPQAL